MKAKLQDNGENGNIITWKQQQKTMTNITASTEYETWYLNCFTLAYNVV